jgi:ribosomal protein L15
MGKGYLSKIDLRCDALSSSAKEKIEKAGGTIIQKKQEWNKGN